MGELDEELVEELLDAASARDWRLVDETLLCLEGSSLDVGLTARSASDDIRVKSALLAACEEGREDLLRGLVDFCGGDPNARLNDQGETCLHVVCRIGHEKAASHLLQMGAKIFLDKKGVTPISYALQHHFSWSIAIETPLSQRASESRKSVESKIAESKDASALTLFSAVTSLSGLCVHENDDEDMFHRPSTTRSRFKTLPIFDTMSRSIASRERVQTARLGTRSSRQIVSRALSEAVLRSAEQVPPECGLDSLFSAILLQSLNMAALCRGKKAALEPRRWIFGEDYRPIEDTSFVPAHYKHHAKNTSPGDAFTFFAHSPTGTNYLVRVKRPRCVSETGISLLASLPLDSFSTLRTRSACDPFNALYRDASGIDVPCHSFEGLDDGLAKWLRSRGVDSSFIRVQFHRLQRYDLETGIRLIVERIEDGLHCNELSVSETMQCRDWLFERSVALAGLQLALSVRRLRRAGIAHRLLDASWRRGCLAGMDDFGRVVLLSDSFLGATQIRNAEPVPYQYREQLIVPNSKVFQSRGAQPPEVAKHIMLGPGTAQHLASKSVELADEESASEVDASYNPSSVSLVLMKQGSVFGSTTTEDDTTFDDSVAPESLGVTLDTVYEKADVFGLGNYLLEVLADLTPNARGELGGEESESAIVAAVRKLDASLLSSVGIIEDQYHGAEITVGGKWWSRRHSRALHSLVSLMTVKDASRRLSDDQAVEYFYALLFGPNEAVFGDEARKSEDSHSFLRISSGETKYDKSRRQMPRAATVQGWERWLRRRRCEVALGVDAWTDSFLSRGSVPPGSVSFELTSLMASTVEPEAMKAAWMRLFGYKAPGY